MQERQIDDELLLDITESGTAKWKGRLAPVALQAAARAVGQRRLRRCSARIGAGGQDGDGALSGEGIAMKTVYYPQDDILEIRLSDKAIVRETSQDWNVHLSFADDGTLVELVLLDAVKSGIIPFSGGDRREAA